MEEHSVLLRFVRAACLLDGTAAEATADGVLLTAPAPAWPGPGDAGRDAALIPWREIDGVLAGDDPVDPAPRLRLALLLRLRRAVRALGPAAAESLTRAARPLALPLGHPLHPGPGWVHERVPGDVLDVGLGVARLLPGQEGVLPLPPAVAAAAGLTAQVWSRVDLLADRLGGFALDRADGAPGGGALRGVGGCDGLTLLTLRPVRQWLAGRRSGTGPEAVAVPGRDRIWYGGAASDRDYVSAVWTLTAPARRGIRHPVQVSPGAVTR